MKWNKNPSRLPNAESIYLKHATLNSLSREGWTEINVSSCLSWFRCLSKHQDDCPKVPWWVEWILKACVLENKASTQCVHNAEPERSLILITRFERWPRQFDYVAWANNILLCGIIKGSLNAGDRIIQTTLVPIKGKLEIKVRHFHLIISSVFLDEQCDLDTKICFWE